jgi:hypothetical protein
MVILPLGKENQSNKISNHESNALILLTLFIGLTLRVGKHGCSKVYVSLGINHLGHFYNFFDMFLSPGFDKFVKNLTSHIQNIRGTPSVKILNNMHQTRIKVG